MKKFISIFLALLMIVTAFPLSAFAENKKNPLTESAQELSYNSSNALGDTILSAINEEDAVREEYDEKGIFSVSITGLEATVALSAPDDCTVVVAVYDEKTNQMVSSGKTDVNSDDMQVAVTLSDYILPDFFIVKAFILNSDNDPVCPNYVNLDNTEAFVESYAKTTEDFDSDRVINLDASNEDNFAVVSENAHTAQATDDVNVLAFQDDDNGIYVFDNADSSITGLTEGEILYFSYGDGYDDYILTKVGSIKTANNITTITASDEYEISDFFEYIDIDTSKKQTSQRYVRAFDDESGEHYGKDKIFDLTSGDAAKEFKGENYSLSLKISGSVTFHLKFHYNFKILGKDYYKFEYWLQVDANANATFNINGSFEEKITLINTSFPVITGLDIYFTLKMTVKAEASLTIVGDITFTMKNGASRDSDGEQQKIEQKPTLTFNVDVDGEFTLDLIPEIETGFQILKVFIASMNVPVDFRITGTLYVPTSKDEKNAHPCITCVSGEILCIVKLNISVKFGLKRETADVIIEVKPVDKTFTLGEYYISATSNGIHFDWGKCRDKTTENPTEPDDSSVFENYLKNTLIPKHGISKNFEYTFEELGISGEKAVGQNIPISAIGLNSAYIADLNNDNIPEMITVRTEHGWTMLVESYAYEDNAVVFKECIYVTDKFDNAYEQLRVYILENNGTLNLCITDRFCYTSGGSLFTYNLKIYAIDSNNSAVLNHDFAYQYNRGNVFYSYNNDSYKVQDADTGTETDLAYSTAVMLQNIFAEIGLEEFKYTYKNSETGGYHFDWNNFPTKAQHTKIYEGGTENGIVFNLDYTDLAKKYPAEFETIAMGSCGDNLTWTLYDNGELVIRGIGKMYDYSSSPFKEYASSITKVTINSGVTSIGDFAFEDCKNFRNITIPNGITSIGASAFDSCRIDTITIPESVAAISTDAFNGCLYLTSFIVDNNNAYYSTDSNGVLFNKNKTTIVQYPADNSRTEYTIPDSVTTIDANAFYACFRLKNIQIPNSVKTIGEYAFFCCFDLKEIVIPNSVISIGSTAFMGCHELEIITLYDSLESVGFWLFEECDKLRIIYYTGTEEQWNSIKNIEWNIERFYIIYNHIPSSDPDYDIFETGTCGDNLTWTLYNDGELVISGTGKMKEVTTMEDVPWRHKLELIKTVTISEGVTSFTDELFLACMNIEGFSVDKNNAYYSSDNDGVLFNKNKTKLISYPKGNDRTTYSIPDSVTYISDMTFIDCFSLTSITIPDSVINIGAHAFYSCISLTNVSIGKNVISIGNMAFAYCKELTTITIPDSVRSIGTFLFEGCELETIYYTGTETEWNKIEIGDYNPALKTVIFNSTGSQTYMLSAERTPVGLGVGDFSETVTSAVIGNEYVILVVRDKNAADLLAAENLLFIDQKTADSETLTFSFSLKDGVSDYDVLFTTNDNDDEKDDEKENVVTGDVNGDGKLTASDARAALRMSAKLETYTPEQFAAADVNGDGKLTASDARIILRVSAKLQTF